MLFLIFFLQMLRHDLKRKRKDLAAGNVVAIYKATPKYKRRRTFRPGVDRIGGYYGRFSPAGGELKFHDVDVDDAVIASGGSIQNTGSVNLIAQGVTESQRVGRKCTIRSIQWRYKLSLPETDAVATPGAGDTVRTIVYLDKQCNGAAATAALILQADNYQSFMNVAEEGRFTILMDKVHSLNYAGLASDGAGVVSQAGVRRSFAWSKKCNIPLEFNDTTGALTEIRSNNIGILMVGFTGVSALDSKIRLRFSDGS